MTFSPLEAEIARIRQSGILGRRGPLVGLFDYLVGRYDQDATPKETEIAMDVFRKDGSSIGVQDANVRVHVHRLRRKLEDFYLRAGSPSGTRLAIPKGTYRLEMTCATTPAGLLAEGKSITSPRRSLNRIPIAKVLIVALFAIANAGLWWWLYGRMDDPRGNTAFWSAMDHDGLPVVLVVGDYFLVGDSDDGVNTSRLVREYEINSSQDIYSFLAAHPQKAGHYSDVGLSYLPVSVAKSIQQIAARLTEHKSIDIVMASEFSAEALKTSDVIYIGLLSGLGQLREAVFAASRFQIGDNYDEIVDTQTHTRFLSQGGSFAASGLMYRDYAYISSFAGPAGNRIAIIAGARDAGAAGAADLVSQLPSLQELDRNIGKARSFAALYEVEGELQVNLKARLVAAAGLDPKSIWTQTKYPPLPATATRDRL